MNLVVWNCDNITANLNKKIKHFCNFLGFAKKGWHNFLHYSTTKKMGTHQRSLVVTVSLGALGDWPWSAQEKHLWQWGLNPNKRASIRWAKFWKRPVTWSVCHPSDMRGFVDKIGPFFKSHFFEKKQNINMYEQFSRLTFKQYGVPRGTV